ncbi:Peptidyl-prolyl cis-trans isomerase D [Candidatus Hepatincola sp. Pdp]
MLKNSMKSFSMKRIIIAVIILLVSISMIPWIISNYSLSATKNDDWIKVGSKSTPANVILGEYNAFIQQNYQYVSRNPYALFQYLNNLISQHVMVLLFANEAEKLNIKIDDDILLKIVAEIPAFQKPDGSFDKEKFSSRITSIFGSEKIFLDNIKNNLLKEQLVNSIGGNLHLPYYVGYIELLTMGQVREIKYIDVNSLIKAKIPTATTKDLEKLREDNKKVFTTDESRNGEYVYIRPTLELNKLQVSQQEINNYYKKNQANYMKEEQRSLLEITFMSEEEAKAALQKLPTMKLADIKKTYKVVSLTNIEPIALPNQLATSVFAAKTNVWNVPIASDLGWHVFNVQKITPATPKPLTLVRQEIKAEILADKKKKTIDDLKSKLALMVSKDKFSTIAKKLKGSYYAFHDVNEKNISADKNIIASEDVFHQILGATVNKTSEVIETENGDLLVVRINKINPARLKDIKEIKPQLISMWNKQIKEKQVNDKVASLMVQLSNKPINSLGLTVQTIKISRNMKQLPFARTSLETLFVSEKNKPIEGKLIGGNTFVAITTNIINSKEEYKNNMDIKNQKVVNLSDYLSQQYVQGFFEKYATKLQSEYKVKINEKAIMEKLAPNQ